MKEDSSLRDDIIDRKWVPKSKRKRVSGLDLLNGKEGTSLPSESKLKIPVKRSLKSVSDISTSDQKIKGQDGVRCFLSAKLAHLFVCTVNCLFILFR